MNRSTATMMAILLCAGSAPALAGDAACDRLQSELAERDREVAQHREYSSQLFKQLEAARTALDTAERANAQAQERANAATLKARKEIIEADGARLKELAARDKDLEETRAEIVRLRSEIGKRDAVTNQHDTQLATVKSQAANLESALRAAIAKRDELVIKAKESDASQRELATLRGAMAQRDARISDQAKKIAALEAKGSADVEPLRARVAKLERELGEAITQRDEMVANGDVRAREWQQQAARLTSQVEEGQRQVASWAAKEKDLTAARDEIASLKKDNAELRAAAAERETRVAAEAKAMEGAAKKDAEDTAAIVGAASVKRLAAAVANVAVAPAAAAEIVYDPAKPLALAANGTIKKWQQPDGSLYFGERPQTGSRLVGEVKSMGTAGGSHLH